MAMTHQNKKTFTPVKTSPKGSKAKVRRSASGVLWPSGRLVLNTDAGDIWVALVTEAKEDLGRHVSEFGVDEPGELVAAYVGPWGNEGTGAVKVQPRKGKPHLKTITLDLDGAFTDYPKLRPTGKVQVSVRRDFDAGNRHYLEINLKTAVALKTTPRATDEEKAERLLKAAEAKLNKARKEAEDKLNKTK